MLDCKLKHTHTYIYTYICMDNNQFLNYIERKREREREEKIEKTKKIFIFIINYNFFLVSFFSWLSVDMLPNQNIIIFVLHYFFIF